MPEIHPSPQLIPNLRISLTEAEKEITEQIKRGKRLLKTPIRVFANLANARNALRQWNEYNLALLKRMFGSSAIVGDYDSLKPYGEFHHDIAVDKLRFLENVNALLAQLTGILQRLPLYVEPSLPVATITPKSNKVFIVHGRDDALKKVARDFIAGLGLEPIILHEQANRGLTLIQKINEYSDVAFAVVLLSPDDSGRLQTSSKSKPRARQNVVFEWGFFWGKFGGEHVAALYKENVELPSDLNGVLYIPFDEDGEWKMKLVQELQTVGFNLSSVSVDHETHIN